MVSHLHLWHNATYANIVDILKQMFSVEYSLKYQLDWNCQTRIKIGTDFNTLNKY